jgi:hypothetical protein
MMTSGWTDERLDDLKHQVDELSRRTDEGFATYEERWIRVLMASMRG